MLVLISSTHGVEAIGVGRANLLAATGGPAKAAKGHRGGCWSMHQPYASPGPAELRDNVDLNRNFVDHDKAAQERSYVAIAERSCQEWNEGARRNPARVRALAQKHAPTAAGRSAAAVHPSEASSSAAPADLEQPHHPRHSARTDRARKVGVIDFHTGLAFGHGELICAVPPAQVLRQRQAWYGDE